MHHGEVHQALLPMPLASYTLLFLLAGVVLGLIAGLLFRLAISRLIRSRRERGKDGGGEVRQEGDPARQSLAEALKAQRTAHGMTQEQVAEALEVSRQAVSKWENGTAEPSTSNLLALARLYGVDLNELLGSVQ